MPVNVEFHQFVHSWLNKARGMVLSDLSSHFDRFYTLFVVYNRLYAEATFILARQEQLNLTKRTSFPDKDAATRYVSQYLGSAVLLAAIQDDATTRQALERIAELIDKDEFHIKLNMVTGTPQRQKDTELLSALRSTESNEKATAILETIYSIRCNMFHGHKEFHPVQVEILAPVMVLLEKVVVLLCEKMEDG